jgi:small-conductance mechanosensitive channel
MDSPLLTSIQDIVTFHGPKLAQVFLYVLAVFAVYKLASLFVSSTAKRKMVDPHVENIIRLFLRIAAIIVAVSATFTVYDVPSQYFVGSSALIGAVIGFGSSQTINNVAAGLYVIVSKPFRVKDYVKIGDMEGQVEEISINYTKLYTPTFNLLEIPNVQVLNSRVLNCTHEGFIKNTFVFTVPHLVPIRNEEALSRCIKPAIEELSEKYPKVMLRKPEAYFEASVSFGRSYKIRIFVPKGQAKTLFVLQAELSNRIMDLWDRERLGPAPVQ